MKKQRDSHRQIIGQAYQDLKSETCRPCGRRKKHGQSFCQSCYYSLPLKTQHALYQPSGYPTIYHEALRQIGSASGVCRPSRAQLRRTKRRGQ